MTEKEREYLLQYIDIDEEIERCINIHKKYYKSVGEICAWYKDKKDFYADWQAIGYSRLEADKILRGSKGEFTSLPNGKGIVRFEI